MDVGCTVFVRPRLLCVMLVASLFQDELAGGWGLEGPRRGLRMAILLHVYLGEFILQSVCIMMCDLNVICLGVLYQ